MTNWNFILNSKALLQHPLLLPFAHDLSIVSNSTPPQAHHYFKLCEKEGVLSLQDLRNPKATPMSSKDLVKEWYLRVNSFRGKQEPISKTLGLAKRPLTGLVVDTTAGLGRDSIIMAKLGCHVIMIERELPLGCLLQQALQFAQKESWFQDISGVLELRVGEATDFLSPEEPIRNIGLEKDISAYYCDPMFNHKVNKSANNKRLIQTLQSLCHAQDPQSLDQFLLNKLTPGQRLVVKRAPHDNALTPFLNYQIKGSTFRFDVHYRAAL